MDSYPPALASRIKELAHEVGLWVSAQVSRSAAEVGLAMARIDECRQGCADMSALDPDACYQLRDIAVAAAAVSLCTAFQMGGLEGCKGDLDAACVPRPKDVSQELWLRTQDYFWSAARLACAELRCEGSVVHQEQRVHDRHMRRLVGLRPIGKVQLLPESHQTFQDEAARVMPSTVVMLSTCRETIPGSPRTPYSNAVEGRCTELLLEALGETESRSWMELLWAMRRMAVNGRPGDNRQVPTLSCTQLMDLNQTFGLTHPQPSGRLRALLVGINYVGQEGLQIAVGHKDVAEMRRYLLDHGFPEAEVRVLADDGSHEHPNRTAIEAAMSWLVQDASPGDSLFFLYSGHGCSYTGSSEGGDLEAGFDEALCPADFRSAGMIFDDEIYRLLIGPLRERVRLTCVVDCCQSGTVLHLPYVISANDGVLTESRSLAEDALVMTPNKDYDPGKMLQVIQHHPAMCAAASHWAEELATLNPRHHRRQLGGVLMRLAQTGQTWASRS
mmetsp:Transcript_40101/g.93120  ORF Transcript_40101/g.93120 Transcript_40101/m.93120 type:complete len:501 (-) Transcript_40101:74-1576(-)